MGSISNQRDRIIQAYVSSGYPGINKLRAVCYQPLVTQICQVTHLPPDEVQKRWKLLPPREFWPTIRRYAQEHGLKNWQAYLRLANMWPDPSQDCSHPLLCQR